MIASAVDIDEAAEAGRAGVKAALAGETGKMIAFCRVSETPYRMECRTVDVNEVCNREKPVPAEWITGDANDIGQAFIDYALPLIQGEVARVMEDGVPKYLERKIK